MSLKEYKKQKLVTVLTKLNKEQWEDLTDGHGDFKPTFYYGMGFPKEFVDKNISVTKSDGTYTGSLWKDPDKAMYVISQIQRVPKDQDVPAELVEKFNELYIPEVEGITNLEFLTNLAGEVGVSFDECLGRGRQARYIVTALQKSLKVELTCDF